MTDKVRPPFILVIIADSQGCGHHRCMIPTASLVESGIADARIDISLWPDHVLQAAAPDVIVFQRQVEDGALDTIERWRKLLPNTLFIYELDDYLGEIPPASFHAGFMPPNIAEKVGRALSLCDRATTTTEPMAEWLRSLGSKDVRVVPNALPLNRLRERDPRQSGKLRVGFAGGMSHSGDLRLIEPAMEAIGDGVEWVFFGARSDGARDVRIEFHEGQSPQTYLDGMAKLDVDVFLAPLEDNAFNRCKSNLRLVESGAMGACVIAQDMPTYRLNEPPVFAYASNPDEWTAAIRAFMSASVAERRRKADALRSWVGRHYVLERILSARTEAWLPAGEKWKPQAAFRKDQQVLVSSQEDKEGLLERMPFLRRCRIDGRGLEKAASDAIARGMDLLWLRPATSMGEMTYNSVLATLRQAPEVASAVPLASDGVGAFPKVDEWMPMSQGNVASMESILMKRLRRRRLAINAPCGPCVMLSASALSMLGIPDVAGAGSEEQAIMEWGLRAAMREWKHMQSADAFASSLAPPPQATAGQSLRLQARGTATRLQMPSESLTAADREAIELELLGANWGGPRPGSLGFGTDYEAWKALVAVQRWVGDEGPERLPSGPLPAVSVVGFGSAPKPFGWLVHVDDFVELDKGALDAFTAEIWKAAAKPGADVQVVYFDHESRFMDGKLGPEFKPDFDLELFLAQDYVTPLCAVRVNVPFADRTALFAHVLDIALKDGAKAFVHIPRTIGSMKVQVRPEEMALDALQRQIVVQDRLGETATVTAHRRVPGCLSIVRNWNSRSDGHGGFEHFKDHAVPLVSIVIPTLGGGRLIQPCVNTIRQHTGYPNYEIVVVQNGARQEPELGEAVNDPRVRVVRWEGGFNWSAINNWAIRFHCKGQYICTVNDDVNFGSKSWLDNMMGHAVLPDVGAVGARLLHPAGFMQHVGVVAHKGIAGHMHKGMPNGQFGHLGRAVITHEATAVTGACMLFKRRDFDAVNGFDESMARNYNDTDFCIRLRRFGLRNVVEMSAELLHPEGASRGDVMSPDSLKELARENRAFAKKHPEPDPYWNPNLQIGLVHGGVMIHGLNAELLAFDDFRATPSQERVLVVNDRPGIDGVSLDLIGAGSVPMAADLSGFRMRMTGPIPRNVQPWDVRDPERIAEGLRLLGVRRIVLRSLVGAEGAAPPVEALRCLAQLDMIVDIDPVEDWMVRPVLTDGYEDQRKAFGSVDAEAWSLAYEPFVPVDTRSKAAYSYEVTSIESEDAAE